MFPAIIPETKKGMNGKPISIQTHLKFKSRDSRKKKQRKKPDSPQRSQRPLRGRSGRGETRGRRI